MMEFLTDDVWQLANGVLAILGVFLVGVVLLYLAKNVERVYREPIRFLTLAFALIVLGHTIKDGSGYLMRGWHIVPYDWVILVAMAMVAMGKLGCILIWSDSDWGHKPWIIALTTVSVFLIWNAWG